MRGPTRRALTHFHGMVRLISSQYVEMRGPTQRTLTNMDVEPDIVLVQSRYEACPTKRVVQMKNCSN